MHLKRWAAAIAVPMVIVLATFALAGPAAAGKPGSSPDDALPVGAGPATVAPGQRIWYGFQYAGDNSPMAVRMSANPAGAAKFSVWSGNDVHNVAQGNAESPMGRGAPNKYFGGDDYWAGASGGPGVYYVVVDGTGSGPASYVLSVSGPGVGSLPAPVRVPAPATPAAPPPVAVAPAGEPAGAAPAYVFTRIPPTPTPTAQDPSSAMPIPEGVQTLGAGQRIWYAFHYAGDNSPVIVDMNAPAGTTSYGVWSPSDVQKWAQGAKENPSGRGTTSALFGGDLVWVGNSREPGAYYVVVDQAASGAGSYKLSVTGSGVSPAFPPAPAAATPAPPPAAVAQPAAAAGPVYTPYVFTRPSPTPTPLGQNPEGGLPIPAGAQSLDVGRRVWYAFQYTGGSGEILVRLNANPPGSARFGVWAPEDVQRWAGGAREQPMGQGTPNGQFGGDLVWVGNPKVTGTYYVVVDQQGPVPSAYTVSVNTAYR